ncbi:MAG: bifunctional aspartate transaminase/aspartate 4-decarboxylase, partial [Iodobacter sp.]
KEYGLNVINVNAPSDNNWQFTTKELDKLRDPKVKAFFLVNPSNPPSTRMSDEMLQYLADIVKERPDLIILTDDVYGTFCEDFVSIYAYCPYNTMLVYSYSKYFGATGWRMGLIATEKKNVFDDLIAQLPEALTEELDERYSSITTEPRKLKFIDRMVADSRTVALNHTAGLSTPIQVQMVLFSLFSLMDEPQSYKKAMKRIVQRRKSALYRHIGLKTEFDPLSADYYHLLDLERVGKELFGEGYVKWMRANIRPNELQFRLAEKCGVVLLPGMGFGTPAPSSRVSLANLNEYEYIQIGRAMKEVRDEFHQRYLNDLANK